jgi:hypothetical protein
MCRHLDLTSDGQHRWLIGRPVSDAPQSDGFKVRRVAGTDLAALLHCFNPVASGRWGATLHVYQTVQNGVGTERISLSLVSVFSFATPGLVRHL